ncbi:F-box only protein 4 isoform X2 [Corythoichthys intestinalis]|uniref:F-box only protein 4 isoform X2 n=1 Tax=Corythoichthys intestinalis TaxID=161448 RepID=UPI0025A4D2DE|nr:F-box only protein 4 isoform X2 [Corythoichthys intestinalis]
MTGKTTQHSESVVIRNLRRLKEFYWPSSVSEVVNCGEEEPGFLDSLPVDVQFQVMTLLSSVDICRLGATSRYWRAFVRDPLLWRFLLLRDIPHWPSIDHLTMPQVDAPEAPGISEDSELDDYERTETRIDYMAEYLKGCPSCRERWLPLWPPYRVLVSFLQSLVPSAEPRYAMFGPGMEQMDVSIVTRLMHASDILPVSVNPNSHINGPSVIGSGISFMFNDQHKFNIFTLYSTNRAERDRAKVQNQYMSDKLFTLVGSDESGHPVYRPSPQVQQVCKVVDGVIYVANAQPGRERNVKQSGPPDFKPRVARPVLTWQTDSVYLSCLIPGWCRIQLQNPCPVFWMAFLGC